MPTTMSGPGGQGSDDGGGRPARGPAFELDAVDLALLAAVFLTLVPGIRVVAAWLTIGFVPGWFVARRVLAVEGFARVPLALALSTALSWVVILPLTVLVGRPTAPGIVASILLFAVTCSHRRARWPVAWPAVPAPPRAFTALLSTFVLLRVAVAARMEEPRRAVPDDPYFIGMVRSLSLSFPPANPEAAGHRLVQPWAYWFEYAALHVTSGCTPARTMALASAILAVGFAGVLYMMAAALTGERRAGALTLPLALGGGGVHWIAEAITSHVWFVDHVGWGTIHADGQNVWNGFYNLPPLIVLTLALLAATLALRDRSRRLAWVAFGLSVVLPFLHPTYFLVGLLAAGAALLFEVGATRARWSALALLAAAPIPFFLLFVRLYARGDLPSQVPFFTDFLSPSYYAERCLQRLDDVFAYAGPWLPIALWAAWRGPMRGRSFVVALLGTTLVLAIFTDNPAHNVHWPLDPLGIALVVLVACECARWTRRWPRVGVAATAVIVILSYPGGRWVRRLPDRLEQIVHPDHRFTPDERDLAAWIGGHSRPDALIVTPDAKGVEVVEGLAGRRVYCGFAFHLSIAMSGPALRTLQEANTAILADPRSALPARDGVDYVVQTATADDAGARAWRAATAPVFENGSYVVYRPL